MSPTAFHPPVARPRRKPEDGAVPLRRRQDPSAPDGTTSAPDGTTSARDGTTSAPDGTTSAPDGTTSARGGKPLQIRSIRLSAIQALTVAGERRLWDRRAARWDAAGAAGLSAVVEAVLRECRRLPVAYAVDLGAGSGNLTIPLARTSGRVLAVDVSHALLERLADKAAAQAVQNIESLARPIEALELAPGSIDLLVSNYALHHLRDADKARVLQRAHAWLRPGGRIVIGDMMFGRTVTSENRQIVLSKASAFLRRGPAGWLRLLKNVLRFSLRIREKPLPPAAWEALAERAGFETVSISHVVSEAYVLVAVKARAEDSPHPVESAA